MVEDMDLKSMASELAKKYGFLEYMVERYIAMFGLKGAISFLESCNKGVKKAIRVNNLKIDERKLIERLRKKGFKLKRVPWVKHGYWVEEMPFSIGATTEYLLGYYYIQSPASMLAVEVLDPRPGETVVDMAASPGGKTTYLSQLMEDEGVVVAVDASRERMRSLRSHISRMGFTNVLCIRMRAEDLPKLGLRFDRVLLDAPCTGEGLVVVDKTRRMSRSLDDVMKLSNKQKRLLEAAVNIIKAGGIIVYSTCSIAPEENELVVDYVVREYDVKVEKVGVKGEPGFVKVLGYEFSEDLRKAIRLYPHTHGTEGFFICRLRA